MWRGVLSFVWLAALSVSALDYQIAYVEFSPYGGDLTLRWFEANDADVSSRMQEIFDRVNVTAVGRYANEINATG